MLVDCCSFENASIVKINDDIDVVAYMVQGSFTNLFDDSVKGGTTFISYTGYFSVNVEGDKSLKFVEGEHITGCYLSLSTSQETL